MVIRRNKSGYKVFSEGGIIRSVHKRVAEKKMGGKVRRGYEVHHIDRDKDNNRPSNLRVIKKSAHRQMHSKKRSFW